ncbi:MAG TPA: Uma2 family endonuclease [Candidatus Polarisedimenticolaceae bacterium]|nr:Uma2 family endonuclease [Candidatus Polarisedimenticolaceae bacterium]
MPEPREEGTTTAEECFALQEQGYRVELQAGFLVEEPRPVARHQVTLQRLIGIVGPIAHRNGGRAVQELDLILARRPDTVRAPDLAVFTREQWERLDPDRPYEGVAELVIEVLTPSNRRGDMHAKIADYLAAGVSTVWVVDPWSSTVRLYETLLSPVVLRGEDRLEGGAALPGLDLCVCELFDPTLPPPR